MSDRQSDVEAEFGRDRNLAFANLRNQPREPIINEGNFHDDYHKPSFLERTTPAFRAAGGMLVPRAIMRESSPSSSMTVSVSSGSASSSATVFLRTPSSGSFPTTASEGHATYGWANAVPPRQIVIQQDSDISGTTTGSSTGGYACPLGFIGCRYQDKSLDRWMGHWQSHFHGGRDLPNAASCPFGCPWKLATTLPEDAPQVWEELTDHIWDEHENQEVVNPHRCSDKYLIEHLRRKNLIESAQYKELRRTGSTTEGLPGMRSAGTLLDHRRRRTRD